MERGEQLASLPSSVCVMCAAYVYGLIIVCDITPVMWFGLHDWFPMSRAGMAMKELKVYNV